MLAAFYTRHGPARDVLQIADIDEIDPGRDEVRVTLATSGVTPSDVKSRQGSTKAALEWPRIVPHSDGAGTITAIGPGVAPSRLGERVWTWNAQWKRPLGTAAQSVVLPTRQAVLLPGATSFEEGACLGVPAQAAYRAVSIDGSVEGQVLLISGGAGAVGRYAVQIAKNKGATVIATVSSPEKAERAREAGADHVINYNQDSVPDRVRELTRGQGADRMLEVDLAANLHLISTCLAPGGTVVVYGSASEMLPTIPVLPLLVQGIGFRFFSVYGLPVAAREAAVADLTAMMHAGQLRHQIAARFPLAQIAAAHEAVESGRMLGNVVVAIQEDARPT